MAALENNCSIAQFTADKMPVGRCWHYLGTGEKKICPIHGDVTEAQKKFVETGVITRDYQLKTKKG